MTKDSGSHVHGSFQFNADLNRYGELLRPSRTLSIDYSYVPADLETVVFGRTIDQNTGDEANPNDYHRASLIHAFKAHLREQEDR